MEPLPTFIKSSITDEIKNKITGVSYPKVEDPRITYKDLSYLTISYKNFKNGTELGHIICHVKIADDLLEIFRELYKIGYQIEKINLIENYKGNDCKSMEDNNTSCFNYRNIVGSKYLSNHAYGLAIDINPLYNPYIRNKDGIITIDPLNATRYCNRELNFEHKIEQNDECYKLFKSHGFEWGGEWDEPKDYQHFEKYIEGINK